MKHTHNLQISARDNNIINIALEDIDYISRDRKTAFKVHFKNEKKTPLVCSFQNGSLAEEIHEKLIAAREAYLAAQNTANEKPPATMQLIEDDQREEFDFADISGISFTFDSHNNAKTCTVHIRHSVNNKKTFHTSIPKKRALAFRQAWRTYKNSR